MLTQKQRFALGTYTCFGCERPLGRYHAYPVNLATLLSRLTESVPMCLDCAERMVEGDCAAARWGKGVMGIPPTTREKVSAVWVVHSSSPKVPTGRLFEKLPGDFWIHLQTPSEIILRGSGNVRAEYTKIMDAMLPEVKAAAEAATTPEETAAIMDQIAWLHRFLPPRPNHSPRIAGH